MRIEEFGSNMLRDITFNITHLHLYNTSNIIFIDNCGVSMLLMPHDFWIWLITCLSQTHSSEGSCNVIISEWLVEVATKVYLDDR